MTKSEYEELVEKIRIYNEAYEGAEPLIPDYEYDQLMLALKAAEKEHPEWKSSASPTAVVGAPVKREAGVTVEHDVPMLSIQDVFSTEDVLSFVREVRAVHPDAAFRVEQKIDGLSMSLRYEGGKLALAETRGDGYIGEDVTLNAMVIPDVPQTLIRDGESRSGNKPPAHPAEAAAIGSFEVRGEVYMSFADFERCNREQETHGRKTFANPRNCAAGTLRQLDPEVTKERGLSFFVFNVQRSEDPSLISSHSRGLAILAEEFGFSTVPGRLCTSDEEILEEIERIGNGRGGLPYQIDGAVVKIDQTAYREDFPAGAKYSAGHIAYKYPPEEKETVIRNIEVSIGMTGRVNPTAVFDPVRLCGTTVSRATLHNQAFINELHIGIGDSVLVYKSGEIIPKIRCSLPEKRPAGVTDFRLPDTCPSCGAPIEREEGKVDLYCVNPDCPAQLLRHLVNFVSRDAMDIKGFGDELIRAVVTRGYVKSIADIYELKNCRDELIENGVIGREKNTDKLLAAIEASKSNEPSRLLTGLAIPNVGKTSARAILRKMGSLDALMEADEEQLLAIPDIGEITARGIVHFFAAPANRALIGRLKAEGLNLADHAGPVSEKLAGKTYVVTGSITRFENRDAFARFIEEHGGKLAGSVSKKTAALINNDAASTSGKNKKARELGIPILTEEEFLAALEEA